MTSRRARWEARAHQQQAQAMADSLRAKLEAGTYPSAIVDGRRVEVLRVQDHPEVGRRYEIRDGLVRWVLAVDASDLRGVA